MAYSSCADMLAGLRARTAASVGSGGLPGALSDGYLYNRGGLQPQAAAPSSRAADSVTPARSTTNVQEADVDEPDLVKSDGNRLVSVSGGVLRVIDTAARRITGRLTLPGAVAWQASDLFLSGDRALVLLHRGTVAGIINETHAGPAPYPTDAPGSTYLLVDLSGRPRVLGSITPRGTYVDARMVGSTVRLVVRSGPDISFPPPPSPKLTEAQRTVRNRAVVHSAPLSAWLPTYDLSVAGRARTASVPCAAVRHPVEYTGTAMLTIYTIDLMRGLDVTSPVSLAADGDTVYATKSSLYVTSNPDWWACCAAAFAGPAADPDSGTTALPVRPAGPARRPETTEIHRFDITGPGAPGYLGSGSVPGRLLSQYSLSEFDGHLRVATTAAAGAGSAESSVYVLAADTLAMTGRVGGLGRGERIYAVRFAGPLGYVVTFRQVDPLYVLDLHDPAAPREVGELKITGYSSYLHPVGDGWLIGVGQEADSRGIVAGMQVSLFDVSNPSHPRRAAQVYRKDAPGEDTLDPHAFLYWPASGLVVMPIQSWNGAAAGRALVLKVIGAGAGTALAPVGLISHAAQATGQASDSSAIQRTVVIGDSIWTLSGAGVKVSDMATLADRSWIPFA